MMDEAAPWDSGDPPSPGWDGMGWGLIYEATGKLAGR